MKGTRRPASCFFASFAEKRVQVLIDQVAGRR